MRIGKNIKINKTFATVWFLSYAVLFTLSSIFGIVPEGEEKAVKANASDLERGEMVERGESASSEYKYKAEAPLRIKASSVGLNAPVLNPESRDLSVLDNELAKGAVRYPGSGLPGSGENVFLFGHSSHLPVVNNPAYRTFNGVEKLEEGEEIIIETKSQTFVYKVSSVELVYADTAGVQLDTGKDMLTLVTCNNFGAEEERFLVKAELLRVESR